MNFLKWEVSKLKDSWSTLRNETSALLLQSWYGQIVDEKIRSLRLKVEQIKETLPSRSGAGSEDVFKSKCGMHVSHPHLTELDLVHKQLDELQMQLNTSLKNQRCQDLFRRLLVQKRNIARTLATVADKLDILQERFPSVDDFQAKNSPTTRTNSRTTSTENAFVPCLNIELESPVKRTRSSTHSSISYSILHVRAIILGGMLLAISCCIIISILVPETKIRGAFRGTIEQIFSSGFASGGSQCPEQRTLFPSFLYISRDAVPF